MDPGNERFREVWGNTQDNLETAVGNAYSSWTGFQRSFLVPTWKSVSSCVNQSLQNGMICCFGSRVGSRSYYNSSRRDSFDIFYDMYDDEVYGRDELERLLSAHDNDVVFDEENTDDDDAEREQAHRSDRKKRLATGTGRKGKRSYSSSESEIMDRNNHEILQGEPSASNNAGGHYYQHGMAVEPPIKNQNGLFNISKTQFANLLYSIFPSKSARSTAGTTSSTSSTPSRTANRQRSSTKSSTLSSETYRSRTELFSDDADSALLEDAQMMSDNFAANLEFRSGAESAKSLSGPEDDGEENLETSKQSTESASNTVATADASRTLRLTVENTDVVTDERLRKEEDELARNEEAQIEESRRAAKEKAKSLGLNVQVEQTPVDSSEEPSEP